LVPFIGPFVACTEATLNEAGDVASEVDVKETKEFFLSHMVSPVVFSNIEARENRLTVYSSLARSLPPFFVFSRPAMSMP